MKILAVAGELSGDAHGGPLLRHMAECIPGLEAWGIGGPGMVQAGLHALHPFSDLQVHGFAEVIRHLPRLYGILHELEAWMDRERPDGVLLIDYPGFNLKVAAAAKARGIPVGWYSSPQIWAWRGGRLRTIARVVDKIVVLFPFEVKIYRDAGLAAEFLGHPLVGLEAAAAQVEQLQGRLALHPGWPLVGVMPGSRPSELRRNLPPVLAGIRRIVDSGYRADWALPMAPSLDRAEIDGMVRDAGVPVQVVENAFLPLLKLANLAIVASGTATLQVGLAGIPFIVVYRVAALTYWIARTFAYIQRISIVNILAGRDLAPELLQGDLTPEKLCAEFLALANDRARQDSVRGGLLKLGQALGEPGAYSRGADALARFFRERGTSRPTSA